MSVAAPDIQVACVSLLALLCRGVCDKWRASVLSKALESTNESVRVTAVRAFPLLLHHLGNSHYNLISTALLYVQIRWTFTPVEDHFIFIWVSCSSRLEDSSEQVKRELAKTVGQLSCLQSDTSQLSTSPCSSELLSQTLCLASEHAGATVASLRASFVKPFLTLLMCQSPSSVKQGILILYYLICSLKAAFPIQECFIYHCIQCVVCYPFSFSRCFASSLPSRESCQWRQ